MIITRAMPTQQTAITGVSRRITAGQEIKAELCRGPERCLDTLEVNALRYRIAVSWDNQTRPLGAPPLVGYPEQTIRDRLDELDEVRSSQQRWIVLCQRLEVAGFPVPARPSAESLEQAASLCQDALAGAEQDTIRAALQL